jgi:hypothetical protein
VALSCKGRGFCPSCMGRRMSAIAANLIERVLSPQSGLRQWELTFPFSWRRLLGPIGDIPPAEFEAQYYAQAAVA